MNTDQMQQFLDRLDASAEANGNWLATLPKSKLRAHVHRLMKRADIVYAIWDEGEGRHILCIKGVALTKDQGEHMVTAIAVHSAADALGLQGEWGDGKTGAVPVLSAALMQTSSTALH